MCKVLDFIINTPERGEWEEEGGGEEERSRKRKKGRRGRNKGNSSVG